MVPIDLLAIGPLVSRDLLADLAEAAAASGAAVAVATRPTTAVSTVIRNRRRLVALLPRG
jgi:hypothetical protein